MRVNRQCINASSLHYVFFLSIMFTTLKSHMIAYYVLYFFFLTCMYHVKYWYWITLSLSLWETDFPIYIQPPCSLHKVTSLIWQYPVTLVNTTFIFYIFSVLFHVHTAEVCFSLVFLYFNTYTLMFPFFLRGVGLVQNHIHPICELETYIAYE